MSKIFVKILHENVSLMCRLINDCSTCILDWLTGHLSFLDIPSFFFFTPNCILRLLEDGKSYTDLRIYNVNIMICETHPIGMSASVS